MSECLGRSDTPYDTVLVSKLQYIQFQELDDSIRAAIVLLLFFVSYMKKALWRRASALDYCPMPCR